MLLRQNGCCKGGSCTPPPAARRHLYFCTLYAAHAPRRTPPARPPPRYVQSARPHKTGEKWGLRVRRSAGRQAPREGGGARPPAAAGPAAARARWPPARWAAPAGRPRCPHTPDTRWCRCVLHVIASVLSFLPLSAFLGLRVSSPPWRVHGMALDVNSIAGFTSPPLAVPPSHIPLSPIHI